MSRNRSRRNRQRARDCRRAAIFVWVNNRKYVLSLMPRGWPGKEHQFFDFSYTPAGKL